MYIAVYIGSARSRARGRGVVGRRFYPVPLHAHVVGFALAVVVTTVAILCVGFVVASVVGAARFAQLIRSSIFYPMLAVSGIFVPLSSLPRPWALLCNVLPMSHAVALLRGAWSARTGSCCCHTSGRSP